MTSKEFVLWLKGFTEGVHEYNITPKQWDLLKEKLKEVKDEPKSIGVPIGVPNTTPNWQWPHYPNPLDNPYKITCDYPGTIDTNPFKYGMTSITGSGTTLPNYAVTTTPGTTGFVTIGNPSTMIHGGSGQLWQSSTSTTYNPESGSWHYTNGGNDIKD